MVPSRYPVGSDGEPEPVEHASRVMPNATLVTQDGLNHAQAFRRSDLVLSHVLAFLGRFTGNS